MKHFLLIFAVFFCLSTSYSQDVPSDSTQTELHIVTKNDGTQFIGVILKNDAREVLIKTEKLGDVYIPKHEIKSIEKVVPSNFKSGKYVGDNPLATRYLLTTNGLPIKKREGYLKINIVGFIDFEMGITDKISAGVMSSIYGMPILGNIKYSTEISKNAHTSFGIIYGNTTWLSSAIFDKPFRIGGGIAYGNLTYGDRKKNLNFSAGYGFVHYLKDHYHYETYTDKWGYTYQEYVYDGVTLEYESVALFSAAGMNQLSAKAAILFDSVIAYKNGDVFYVVSPAVRYMPSSHNVWQFGLSIAGLNDEIVPFPLPLVSYHKKL